MELKLIDIIREQWKLQDTAGVERWAFFPCSTNKKPFYQKGHKFGDGHNSATTDEDIAVEMFGNFTIKSHFLGVAAGEKSGGIYVIDIDVKKENLPEIFKNPDNVETAIENLFGDLPKSETQETLSGGRHILYYDKTIGSLNDAFDFEETGLSIDIKGNGGYFILYEDSINFENISDGPEWLPEYFKSRKAEQKESTADFSENLIEGNRNSGLTAIAGKFYNYGDSIDVLKSFLHGHNLLHCVPPLPTKDVDRIIQSVIDNFSRDYEKTEFKDISEDDFNEFGDFLVPIAPETFLLQDMITESSLTIFTGTSGSGKTWIASDLCIAIAQGTPWLGKTTLQKNVYIIDEESGKDRLIRRFRKLAAGRELLNIHNNTFSESTKRIPIKAQTIRRADISKKQFVKDMRAKIIMDNIGFILIDALVDVTPGKNENDAKEMLPALLNLKQLVEETGVSIAVIHHAGKSESSNSRGSSAIEGAVDAMFKITQDKKTGEITIESKKERDIKEIKIGACIKFSDYSVVIENCDIKEKKLKREFTEEKISILKFIQENPMCHTDDLQGNIPGEWKKIKNAIDSLKEFIKIRPAGSNTKQGNYHSIWPDKHLEVKLIIDKKHRYSVNEENQDYNDS